MIRRAEAIEFRGTADTGRNAPLIIAAETDDGESLELYLKPSGRPELGIEGMANELLAACIAGELGLPVCEPILVTITEEWIDTIRDANLQAVLRNSSPVGFGSKAAGNGWRIWSTEDRIIGQRRPVATAIFAFDAFTGNDDRRSEKPNLLVRNDDLRMIDHELCFRVRLKLFPRLEPWAPGNLSGLTLPERHILGAALKKDRNLDIGALRPGWAGLSNECLANYEAAIPEQWAAATEPIEQAIEHLKTVRDRIDECLAEVERVLA
jgi:hypothetical protein